MSATWIADLGAEELEVTLEPGASEPRWIVRAGDTETELDAVRLPTGGWSIIAGGRSFVVDIAVGADPTQIVAHVDGREVAIVLEDARARRFAKMINHAGGSTTKGETLRADIAGKVVKVEVSVGDVVEPGDPLLVLEAMKMENELCASRGGTVTSIDVVDGDPVDTGQLLLTIS